MFFALSKIVWGMIIPSTFLMIAAIVIIVLLLSGRWTRCVRIAAMVWVMIIGLIVIFPIGDWVLYPWENKTWENKTDNETPSGIIILGGALDPFLSAQHDTIILHSAAERLTSIPTLVARYPNIPVIFSGGSGDIRRQNLREADYVRTLFQEWKIDGTHIQYERDSRNTHENAVFSARIRPNDGEWLLVTSADHMPRAHAVFTKAGWRVRPYPVDFNALENPALLCFCYASNLGKIDRLVHEVIGYAVYKMTGKG